PPAASSPRPRLPPASTLFPYPTLFRSLRRRFSDLDLCALQVSDLGTVICRGAVSRDLDIVVKARLRISQADSGQGVRKRREDPRSEEHTSELQSREKLVCRLLLENKNM